MTAMKPASWFSSPCSVKTGLPAWHGLTAQQAHWSNEGTCTAESPNACNIWAVLHASGAAAALEHVNGAQQGPLSSLPALCGNVPDGSQVVSERGAPSECSVPALLSTKTCFVCALQSGSWSEPRPLVSPGGAARKTEARSVAAAVVPRPSSCLGSCLPPCLLSARGNVSCEATGQKACTVDRTCR